jgi:hypothetical protein
MAIRRDGPNIMLKGCCKTSPVAQRQPQRFRGPSQIADLICDGLVTGNHLYAQRLNRLADLIRWCASFGQFACDFGDIDWAHGGVFAPFQDQFVWHICSKCHTYLHMVGCIRPPIPSRDRQEAL